MTPDRERLSAVIAVGAGTGLLIFLSYLLFFYFTEVDINAVLPHRTVKTQTVTFVMKNSLGNKTKIREKYSIPNYLSLKSICL